MVESINWKKTQFTLSSTGASPRDLRYAVKWAINTTLLLSTKFVRNVSLEKVSRTQLMAIDVSSEVPVQRSLINAKTLQKGFNFPQLEDQVVDFLVDDPEHILLALDLKKSQSAECFQTQPTHF